MVKHADLLICDSKNIEAYIQKGITQVSATDDPDGCLVERIQVSLSWSKEDEKVGTWMWWQASLRRRLAILLWDVLYLKITMRPWFVALCSLNSKRFTVLITNVEQNKFYEQLRKDTGFDQDPRVEVCGDCLWSQLLKYILRMLLLIPMVMR